MQVPLFYRYGTEGKFTELLSSKSGREARSFHSQFSAPFPVLDGYSLFGACRSWHVWLQHSSETQGPCGRKPEANIRQRLSLDQKARMYKSYSLVLFEKCL